MGSSTLRRQILGGSLGTAHAGPLFTKSKRNGDATEVTCEIVHGHVRHRCDDFEDFLGDVLPDQIDLYENVTDPTMALRADKPDGQLELTLSATNQAETALMSWGDQLLIPATAAFYFEARVAFNTVPATANRMVIGLASARHANNVLDSVTDHAWFRLEASGALLAEADDSTTDTDDQSTGFTVTADLWYYLIIDGRETGKISYQIAEADGDGFRQLTTIAASDFASTDLLQPFIAVQKDSGTAQPSLYVDYYRVSWDRSEAVT